MSTTVLSKSQDHATERQMSFIDSLVQEVEGSWSPKVRAETRDMIDGGLTKEQASKWISRLLSIREDLRRTTTVRRANNVPEPLPAVPAGRYAIDGADGSVDFYRVDRPTEGRWAGYTFVKLQVSDEFKRLDISHSRTSLQKIIEAGPEQASKRYGKEIGSCGVCGRTLTNNDSIAAGIGPVCAEKMGWSI
jgi:hypothetical protein